MEASLEPLGLAARVLGATCVAVTLLPVLRLRAWWVRIWDFPRLQIALAALVALAGMALAGPPAGYVAWLLVVATMLAAAWQVAVVLPYTPLWRAQSVRSGGQPGPGTLRLLVVNVLMTNREPERLLAVLREADPDVVLAVEVDAWWVERLAGLRATHPHGIEHPQDDTYGLLLRSRLPLIEPEVRFLLHDTIPSVRAGLRLRSGALVRLYAVHPEPPSPTEAGSSLGRDAELVIIGREIARRTRPTVVAGDLNDVAWSHTSRLFRRLSRLLDPRVGRGLYATFHAGVPWLRWPLDHVFHSEDFLLREMRRLPTFGSDHFPILAVLDHAPRDGRLLQEAPEADAEDREEARETVAEAKAAMAAGELATARQGD